MIQTLFILNSSGTIVLRKDYREHTPRSVVDFFWNEVNRAPSPIDVAPILTAPRNYIFHIYRGGLFYMAPVSGEVAPILVLELLHRIADTFQVYFGPKDATESKIRKNFAICFQLLEEILDDGKPFVTRENALTSAIAPPSWAQSVASVVTGKSSIAEGVGKGLLTNMPWRKYGVKYVQNEVYFDIIEEINVCIDKKGKSTSTDVNGRIECTSHLSGTPDIAMDFRNSNALGDCSWHQCVRVKRWQRERQVSFVPPDGTFILGNYRLRDVSQVQLPFFVTSEIRYDQHSGRVQVRVGPRPGTNLCRSESSKKNPLNAEKVTIIIQFPQFVRSTDLKAGHGKVRYDESTKEARWEIGTMPQNMSGDKLELRGRIAIHELEEVRQATLFDDNKDNGVRSPSSSIDKSDNKAAVHYHSVPMRVEFSIPKSNVSGLQLANINIKNVKYKANKMSRMHTRAGTYEMRL